MDKYYVVYHRQAGYVTPKNHCDMFTGDVNEARRFSNRESAECEIMSYQEQVEEIDIS